LANTNNFCGRNNKMKSLRFCIICKQFLLFLFLLAPIAGGAETLSTEVVVSAAQEQEAAPVMVGIVGGIHGQVDLFMTKLEDFRLGLEFLPNQLHTINARFFEIENFFLILVLMFFVAWVVEKLATIKLRRFTHNIERQDESSWYNKVAYMLLGSLFRLIALLIFGLVAISIPIIVYEPTDMGRILLITVLSIVVSLRLVSILATALLAPQARGIRPLPMGCPQALRLYIWIMVFSLVYAVTINVTELLRVLGFQNELVSVIMIAMGLVLSLLVIGTALLERNTINEMFHDNNAEQSAPIKLIIKSSWPLLASIWIVILWSMWGFNIFLDNLAQVEKISAVWWITLAFPLLDRLVYALLNRIVSLPVLQVGSFPKRSPRIVAVVLNGFRIILFMVALIALSQAWGWQSFDIVQSSGGQAVLARIGDILVIGLLAYVTWEAVRLVVERKMPDEPEGGASGVGDGGEGGATRTETLLPLLRNFIMTILVIVVALTVMHSLGIEIGPLLAGAGVIGIAIGFGAQKLVQDVISGIFFLLDDAFRRGEYIITGTLKGTVEKISMRSMQLRHHLGALQTVPYGEIGTVKNLSRDWVTMKLELRLPYNADLEKVRKTIKKIGQELLQHEELGPQFILPLKSQGVVRTEESALIVRMKFTTHPGKQWVVRREAYQRVRDALSKAGIEFAHREVTVRLPKDYYGVDRQQATPETITPTPTPENKPVIEQAAAAATSAIIAAELARQDKIDSDDGGGGGGGDDR
jgi:small-conductance mechanosensitive channel